MTSVVARSLFGAFEKLEHGCTLEANIPRELSQRDIDHLEIHFKLVAGGYAWVFPKREMLTVGVGGPLQRKPALKEIMVDFLIQQFGSAPEVRVKGHYIPFGNYRKQPGRGGVLLAGDAAGLVEPITGEGIAFAMQSGKFAAESILEAARSGSPAVALQLYERRYREITKMINTANRMRYMLFPPLMLRLFAGTIRNNKGPMRAHLDLLSDEVSYRWYLPYLVMLTAHGFFESWIRRGKRELGSRRRSRRSRT